MLLGTVTRERFPPNADFVNLSIPSAHFHPKPSIFPIFHYLMAEQLHVPFHSVLLAFLILLIFVIDLVCFVNIGFVGLHSLVSVVLGVIWQTKNREGTLSSPLCKFQTQD